MTAVGTTWKATAQLAWFRNGRQVGEDRYSFEVECPAPPQDDRLLPINMNRLVTLQLMCVEAERRYGVPPRVVQIRLDGDDLGVVPSLDRARWRADGGFCHGTGIMGVAVPPPGARLVDVQKVQVGK